MKRLAAISGLIVVCLLGARADEPKAPPKSDARPQHERMLKGEDAKRAKELLEKIVAAKSAFKPKEGIAPCEELLKLRTALQGADHWETVDIKWLLDGLHKLSELSPEQIDNWRKAEKANAQADQLHRAGQIARTKPLWEQHLAWRREVFGEKHYETAIGIDNLAQSLGALGDHAKSQELLKQALEMKRELAGERHPVTAITYSNLGGSLFLLGKPDGAELHIRKALELYRDVFGEKHPDTALTYNNLATVLYAQAKFADALPVYQRALELHIELLGDRHFYVALCYSNLATALDELGKHGAAQPMHEQALAIRLESRGQVHPETGTSYNNLALNLSRQGKYPEAQPLFQQALDVHLSLYGEIHASTAASYANLAANLGSQGKPDAAHRHYKTALDISTKALGADHPQTALAQLNVAGNLDALGKYVEAEAVHQLALDLLIRVVGRRHPRTASCYDNLASNLDAQGKWTEAEKLHKTSLDLHRELLGEKHSATLIAYQGFANNLIAQGKIDGAREMLAGAAKAYEAARLDVAGRGLGRAEFGRQRSPYRTLAAVNARLESGEAAWNAIETDLARGFSDEGAARRGAALTIEEQKQQQELSGKLTQVQTRILRLVAKQKLSEAEAGELAKLQADRATSEGKLADLAVTLSQRELASLADLQKAISSDAGVLLWIDVRPSISGVDEHWACLVRHTGGPKWVRLPGSGPDGKWAKEDSELAGDFRKALVDGADVSAVAAKLFAQRLAPIEKHLTGVKTLYVVPVNEMAGIPIEALTGNYTISYVPSGSFLAKVKEMPRSTSTRLLAVGDPTFPQREKPKSLTSLPPGGLVILQVVAGSAADKVRLKPGDVLLKYAGVDLKSADDLSKAIASNKDPSVEVVAWREGAEKTLDVASGKLGVVLDRQPAPEALTAKRKGDEALARVRGGSWDELPGTRVEVERLKDLFGRSNAVMLAGSAASEQELESLRKADRLKDLRYIHFATHGQGNGARAFESALILAQDSPSKTALPKAGEPVLDGRLTANEVLEYWKLNADLVTLSACETAIGRKGGGDGMLGFAQAFLLAGSRSVCLSLWKVDDSATALLMDRFYRNLLGKREDRAKPMGKAQALDEAKRWLRGLSADEAGKRLGALADGVFRGEKPARPQMKDIPRPKDAPAGHKPYAHPRYWAAFILIGDPE